MTGDDVVVIRRAGVRRGRDGGNGGVERGDVDIRSGRRGHEARLEIADTLRVGGRDARRRRAAAADAGAKRRRVRAAQIAAGAVGAAADGIGQAVGCLHGRVVGAGAGGRLCARQGGHQDGAPHVVATDAGSRRVFQIAVARETLAVGPKAWSVGDEPEIGSADE